MLVLGGYIRAQATSKRQDGRCKRPVNPCDISNRSPPSFTGKVGRQSRGTGSSRWMTELALALESPDSLWDHLERGGGEGQSGQWGLRGGPAVQTCCSRAAAREPWTLRPEPTCPPWPPFLAPGRPALRPRRIPGSGAGTMAGNAAGSAGPTPASPGTSGGRETWARRDRLLFPPLTSCWTLKCSHLPPLSQALAPVLWRSWVAFTSPHP